MIIVIILLVLVGLFKGHMDAIADTGVKGVDWIHKYNFTKSGDTKHWWYFGLYHPRYPERFPFSSTILVFVTDKWHRSQFLMLRCFYIAVALLISVDIVNILILSFVVFPILIGVVFEISYSQYRKKYRSQYNNSYKTTGDEPYDNPQVTSVPEKQIND